MGVLFPKIVFQTSTSIVLVLALFSCQPLSSKRGTTSAIRKQPKSDSTITKFEPPEGFANPFTATTPIDSTTLRRKIPTLREQMEKLQTQQESVNSKIDSLRLELAAVKSAMMQQTREEPTNKSTTPLPKSNLTKPKRQSEEPLAGSELRGEKPTTAKKENSTSPKQDIAAESVPTPNELQTQPPAKKIRNVIMPDGASTEEQEPLTQSAAKQPTKKKPSKSSVILPDEPIVAKKSATPTKRETDNIEAKAVKSTERQAENLNQTNAKTEKNVSESTSKTTTTAMQNPIQNAVSYNTALTLFAKKQYEEAIGLLSDVAAKEKDQNAIGNCYYWMGESYYGLGKFDDAVKSFEKVLQLKSAYKSDDALAMIGESYTRQGNTLEAKKAFQRLVAQFPQSENIPKARKRLQQL